MLKQTRAMTGSSFVAVAIIGLSAAVCSAQADTRYYLDALNGNDGNPGTSTQPWQTMQRAYPGVGNPAVHDGDTVVIRNGQYGDFFRNQSLAQGVTDWITYQADEGHHPEFTKILIDNQPTQDTYLRFRDLTVNGAVAKAVNLRGARHVELIGCTLLGHGYSWGAPQPSISVTGIYAWSGADYITIDGCVIRSGGFSTLSDHPTASTMQGFFNGILLSAEHIAIANTEIMNCGKHIQAFHEALDGRIINNHLHNIAADGIILGGSKSLLIEGNNVHDLQEYEVSLAEDPVTTTWSKDGKTMFNPNAKWNTLGDTQVTEKMELHNKAGTSRYLLWNSPKDISTITDATIEWRSSIRPEPTWSSTAGKCYVGDRVQEAGDSPYIASGIVYVCMSGHSSSAATEPGKGTDWKTVWRLVDEKDLLPPSNVTYKIVSREHCDAIQFNRVTPETPANNVTIRGNKFYDPHGQVAWLNATYAANWLVENNLFVGDFVDAVREAGYFSTMMGPVDGLVWRNNIVIGSLDINNKARNVQVYNNILSMARWPADHPGIIREEYNIINRKGWSCTAPYAPTTIVLNGEWDNADFYGLFAGGKTAREHIDEDSFQHASDKTMAIGHSAPVDFPECDINGVHRSKPADAGCYQFVPKGQKR